MGVIAAIIGLGRRVKVIGGAAGGVVRAATGIGIGAQQAAHERSLTEVATRHIDQPTAGFRSFLDSLNHLPGPIVVITTTVMIGFAMISPDAFAARMNGLNQVPEPLWWLMGGLVSFYFGTREIRQARIRALFEALAAAVLPGNVEDGAPAPVPDLAPGLPMPDSFADNAALRDWAALKG